jgi:hypothetical protein
MLNCCVGWIRMRFAWLVSFVGYEFTNQLVLAYLQYVCINVSYIQQHACIYVTLTGNKLTRYYLLISIYK